jgi:hypothetical protein
VKGVTSDVTVECFLRPETKWTGAVKLNCVLHGQPFTFSRVFVASQPMSDVWKLDSTYDIYLAKNGCTHVGGAVGRQGTFIYEYFGGTKVD